MSTDVDWERLRTHLAINGRLTDRGHSRYAHITTCHTCNHQILAGIDWTIEDFKPNAEIYVEAQPLSAAGELTALLLDRATYNLELDPSDGRWRLWRRRRYDRWTDTFGSNPIGPGQKFDVVAAHSCGSHLPSQPTVHPALKPLPIDPPF